MTLCICGFPTQRRTTYDRFTYCEKKTLTALLPAAVDLKESMKKTCAGRASPFAETLLCVQALTGDRQLAQWCDPPILFYPYLSEGCPSYEKISAIVSSPICVSIVSNYWARRLSESDY